MLDMHASSKIQSLLPPQPPQMSIDPSVSKQVWAKYVDAILTYQREFSIIKSDCSIPNGTDKQRP